MAEFNLLTLARLLLAEHRADRDHARLNTGLHSSRHSAIADWQLRGDGSLEGA
jgi:hypothetical protein